MAENVVGTPISTRSTSSQHREVISLAQPRPGQARRHNEYIETPLRPPAGVIPPGIPKTAKPIRPSSAKPNSNGSFLPAVHTTVSRSRTLVQHQHQQANLGVNNNASVLIGTALVVSSTQPIVVTNQPTTFKKEKSAESVESGGGGGVVGGGAGGDGHGDSIICRQCGRCKCEDCRTPRPLPSKWICNDKFLCSASAMVDYCSCLCCAKGLFYHLTKDYEMDNDVSCADQPCSCAPHKRCLRWSCLGLLSLALPCLCCYWPMKGCVRLCEIAYSGVASNGCNCNQRTDTKTPEKRLLDSNSDC